MTLSSEKPPFKPVMMRDVLAAEGSAGLRVASTFSGAGGSCLGYRLAGFSVAWANEFEPTAAETYKANAQDGCLLDTRDIRTVTGADVLAALGIGVGELDLFDGSPPCQSFSTAGKRERGWGKSIAHADGTTQRSDDLFEEYIRLVREIQPRVFIAENVTGLVKGTAKGYFKRLLVWMREAGYSVECRVVDARWLGVPQARQRAIFVGVRNDIAAALGPVQRYPTPARWFYSVADACPWIVSHGTSPTLRDSADESSHTIVAGGLSGGAGTTIALGGVYEHNYYDMGHPFDAASSTIQADSGQQRIWPVVRGAAFTYQGASSFVSVPEEVTDKASPTIISGRETMFAVTEGVHPQTEDPVEMEEKSLGESAMRSWLETKVGKSHAKNFSCVRPDPNAAAPTINASHGITDGHGRATMHGTNHPFIARRFTILEVKRLCSFPDDFKMIGKFDQRWARLGNAVPPLMMKAIAETVRDNILLPAKAIGL